MNSLGDFEPMKRSEDGCDVLKFWGSGNSTGGGILNELKTIDILSRGIKIE